MSLLGLRSNSCLFFIFRLVCFFSLFSLLVINVVVAGLTDFPYILHYLNFHFIRVLCLQYLWKFSYMYIVDRLKSHPPFTCFHILKSLRIVVVLLIPFLSILMLQIPTHFLLQKLDSLHWAQASSVFLFHQHQQGVLPDVVFHSQPWSSTCLFSTKFSIC